MTQTTSSPPEQTPGPISQAAGSQSSDSQASGSQAPAQRAPQASAKRRGGPSQWVLVNLLLPVGILAVGALAIMAFGKQAPPIKPPEDMSFAARVKQLPEADTLPVRSLDAVGGELNLAVDGVVVPYREVQLATEVAGRIVYKDAACEVGSYVKKGQLLIRIDDTDYRNDVERLTSLKEQEYQAIRELDQEMVNTQRLLDVATEQVALQDREIERLKSLPSGFASAAEIDSAQRARLQAVNNRVTLENQLAAMRQRRSRLEAAESLAQTQLEMAQINLDRAEIRAPVSGVVFREDAELNSFVQRGQVVVTIEDTSKAEVVINLRPDQLFWVLDQKADTTSGASDGSQTAGVETSADQVVDRPAAAGYSIPRTPAAVRFRVAGRENEMFEWRGNLEKYDGIGVDETSRTVPVRVVVDQPRNKRIVNRMGKPIDKPSAPMALVRGMFVSVELQIKPQRPLMVVPGVALKPGSDGNRLWRFAADRSVLDLAVKPAGPAGVAGSETANSGEVVQGKAGGAATKESQGDGQASAEDATPPVFEPEQWAVGRIEVIEQVRPIESARLLAGDDVDGKLALDSTGKATYWVCEIGQGGLQPGDRLVVSPLASFEQGGVNPVRIPTSELTAEIAGPTSVISGESASKTPGSTNGITEPSGSDSSADDADESNSEPVGKGSAAE